MTPFLLLIIPDNPTPSFIHSIRPTVLNHFLSTEVHQQVSDLSFYIRESVPLGDAFSGEIVPPSISPPQ